MSFPLYAAGMGVVEMELSTEEPITDEMPALIGRALIGTHYPLENPRIESIPGDPLREPHPAEPGVGPDGEAAPLENPDDSFAADPLRPSAARG